MKHTLQIILLALALSAVAILALFGFAVWVFIPLLPAGIIFIMILSARRGVIIPEQHRETETGKKTDTDSRKAA